VVAVRLYLVQHGEATSEAEDPDRPLTDRGAGQVRQVAAAATAARLVDVERIVHSGKTRARQTAEMWAEKLGVPVETADGLSPGDDPSIWAGRLTGGSVMMVGHLPHLAKLAGLLIVGEEGRPVVTFRNGGLVGLEQDDRSWSVIVVLPPTPVPG
jgi:phosphohistidine phosphatase